MNVFAFAVKSAFERIKLSSSAEQEVERLLKDVLPHTEWAGKLHAVGGYVRDQYLKEITKDTSLEPKDLDIMVDSPTGGGAHDATHYLSYFFNKSKPGTISAPHQMGEAYPIWQLVFKNNVIFQGKEYNTAGAQIEFADSQKETYPDQESRQRVTVPATVEEDIMRRDFTVNMLLKDLATGEIKDMTGRSKEDIKKGILVGHPMVSLDKMFSEDPLRMLRLIRFRGKYGWVIPDYMKDAVRRNAERINVISSERIMGELSKIMEYGKLHETINFMNDTGLLKYVMPEVEALKGAPQDPKWHGEGDVFTHTMLVLEKAGKGIHRQMAALLHDIGKPETTKFVGDEIQQYGHNVVGAKIAEAMMRRLKFELKDIEKVKKMIENHMQPLEMTQEARKSQISPKTLRRFVRKIGDDLIQDLIDLARADELSSLPSHDNIPDLWNEIQKARAQAPMRKKPILNGKEIMELLGIQTGPKVGEAQDYLIEYEDDLGRELTKDEAVTALKKKFEKQ